MKIDLRSDNVSGVAPEIMAAITEANRGTALSYGADDWTERLQHRFAEVFEHQCFVQPMVTGTATNALSLALLAPAWGAICCTEVAHVHDSECGAGEMFTGGAKFMPLPHELGRLRADVLERYLAGVGGAGTSVAPPKVLSLTQATERGTLYARSDLAELAEIARGHGMRVHLDGARFANAVAALDCSPADLTWRAGVDAVSFGATKNGCLAAEAVLVFDRGLAEALRYRARKAGQVLSKMRFVSAQLEAYLADGLWLKLAARANRAGARLAASLTDLPGVHLLFPVEINELFLKLDAHRLRRFCTEGIGYADRGAGEIRLVTAFDTDAATVDQVIARLRGHPDAEPALPLE